MGTLELIYGCMFSGKTSKLIDRYNELKDKLNHVIELVKQHPNDMELGGKVRHYTYENLNKDNA